MDESIHILGMLVTSTYYYYKTKDTKSTALIMYIQFLIGSLCEAPWNMLCSPCGIPLPYNRGMNVQFGKR